MFTDQDIRQFRSMGITTGEIENQLENFRKGFPPVKLKAPATPGNGIIRITEKEINEYIALYEASLSKNEVVKFVPASGAATRMFKELYSFVEKSREMSREKELFDKSDSLKEFFGRINDFAFFDELNAAAKDTGVSLAKLLISRKYVEILDLFLDKKGLDYGNLPKGLLKFHKYPASSRTAFEEHLAEGAYYAKTQNNRVRLHFTVSPEYLDAFSRYFSKVRDYYENMYSVKYEVSFSTQKPSTNTIAVDLNNHPFRMENGKILFRPGGHGALLENLDEINADIIFIKNIDNISPESNKITTSRYKKLLAGIMLAYKNKIFHCLKVLENPKPDTKLLEEICIFLERIGCKINKDELKYPALENLRNLLGSKLNRPFRVCGMVKNEGEPGGGPFWIQDKNGLLSLQIVETSQINLNDPGQKEILDSSTHFNPTDLVCGVRNQYGEKFHLLSYRDPETGFISEKSAAGYTLKAQELPGLWNGAMAFWNTIFVEVPIETFTPVKTVNDLLRPEHQV